MEAPLNQPNKDHGNLTIFGRNPVLEALQDKSLNCLKVHLADSNKKAAIIDDIQRLAKKRQVPVLFHDKMALSRISKNSKQDQGVAIDIQCDSLRSSKALLQHEGPCHLIALDRVNNPQNLGMAIRSIGASPMDGLLLAQDKGTTKISPLVIKASAGAFFKTPLFQCESLAATLMELKDQGFQVVTLSANAEQSLMDFTAADKCIFVLGNESDGLSDAVCGCSDVEAFIPMRRGVESLNLAVTAGVVAFLGKR